MTVTKTDDSHIRAQLVALTRDLMLVPTTASRPQEIDRGLQLIKNHLEGLKQVRIHEYEDKGVPSLVALPAGVKKPRILLCAHLDVIDYPSSSAFYSKINQGRIYGPGAGDMKGCLAIVLEIFRHFHMNAPGISLGLAVTSDEEVGGASGIGFLFDKRNLRCGLALVPDGGSLNQVTTHEKGILHVKIKCTGRFAHASRPWEGDNALLKLIKYFSGLEQIFGSWETEGHQWHPTYAPTIMRTTNEVINRIPDYAEGILDIRFPPPYSSGGILEKIAGGLDKDMQTETLIRAEPTDLQPDPLYFKITEEITGKRVKEVREHGGSDARFIASKGIPVIISRPVVGNLHTQEEWIDIKSMVAFYRIYERYIKAVLKKETGLS